MRQFFIAILAIICSFSWAETIRIEPVKRQCIIILPEKANYGLKFAAEELTYHVEKLTGTKLAWEKGWYRSQHESYNQQNANLNMCGYNETYD